jgi:hypothetical protein
MAELFLREATARPDCSEAVVAHRNFAATSFYFGDFAGAHEHFQNGMSSTTRRAMPISQTGSK